MGTKKKNGANGTSKHGRGPAKPTPTQTAKLQAGQRQLEIPGAGRPRNKALDEVVEPFVEARMKRIHWGNEEDRLHAIVLARMKELKLPTYDISELLDDDDERGRYLEIVPEGEKVKIRRRKRSKSSAKPSASASADASA